MLVNVKKGFILFLCTILLVFNLSATCIKPLTVKATGAELALGGVAVEGISLLLDLIAAGLVSIGAYELYENDERMQIVIDSYIDTWKDPTTGVFSPGRTWGDVEDTTGTFVRDPNTGQWVRNPDTIPSTERPVILTPEEQEYYGVSSNYYDNVNDIAWEIWQNKHGSGGGGGSGGGDDSGGSDTGNDKGTLVKIGSGVIASISAFLASITSGETGNETIDSWVSEIPEPKYTGTLQTDINGFYTVSVITKTIGSSSYTTYDLQYDSTSTLPIFATVGNGFICISIADPSCITTHGKNITSFSYIQRTYTMDGILTKQSTQKSKSAIPVGTDYSVSVPLFNATDYSSIDAFIMNGDDSSCINKEEPQKLVWADMNTLSNALPTTLSPFSTLPQGKAIKATALKDYVNDMTSYKSTATPSDLSNPDTQTQTATQTAQQTVQKNTVDTKTDTEEKDENKPIFVPPSTTPIDIDGSEATRDWRLVFPFCIPFDMIDLYKVLIAEPKAPYWEIPLKVDAIGFEYTFIIDFKQFETLAEIFRLCETIGFILGLALITGKVIKW